MCIISLAWQLFEDAPLLLLSNRDEFIDRPTLPAHQWQDKPIFAARDAQSGGTWLGIHQITTKSPNTDHPTTIQQNGKWASVLNFRDPISPKNPQSRGKLVTDFLQSNLTPMEYARQIDPTAFAGYNLILGDHKQAVLTNNRGYPPTLLPAGLYTLSNGQPSDPWFKTERLRTRTYQEILPLIAQNQPIIPNLHDWPPNLIAPMFDLLNDQTPAPPDQLPNTGIKPELEQALSAIFIHPDRLPKNFPAYATRTQSLLLMAHPKNQVPKLTLISHDLKNP